MTQKSKLKTLTQKNWNKSKTKFNEQKFLNCIKPNALKKMDISLKQNENCEHELKFKKQKKN